MRSRLLGLWKEHTTRSINRRIFRATLAIAALSVIVKFVAVFKELLVAWRFGTGDNLDAFLIAFLIPSLGINVIANSFSTSLIPTYILVREREGPENAQRVFSSITAGSLTLLGVTTLVLTLGAGIYLPWLASGFSAQKLKLTSDLMLVMSPIVLFSGMANIWGAVSNAAERFALVALTPVLTPFVTIVVLLFLRSWGIFALAAGIVGGALLEMIVLGLALKARGISLRPRWYGFDNHTRQIAKQFSPRVAASLLRSGATVADRAFAAMLPSGNVSALSYGSRITSSVVAIAGVALGAAVVPFYSRLAAHHDWRGLRHTLKRYLLLLVVLSVPLVAVLFFFSRAIVDVLFQRGSFTGSDAQVVSQVQSFYVLQIPFYVGNILVARLLSSLLATHITMWSAALNLVLTIVLDVVFIRQFGVPGIALAATCATVLTFLFVLTKSLGILKRKDESAVAQ